MNTKVENLRNKNQFVITTAKPFTLTFQSYESTIAHINEGGGLRLFKDFDYSRTTMKHLYIFLEESLPLLNQETREHIKQTLQSNNKRKALQELINKKKIAYELN